jgi:hypothetical protein
MPLVSGGYPIKADEWLLNGQPSGVFRPNMGRRGASTDVAAALTTQVMLSVGIPLEAGDVVTSLTFLSGATAAGTPLNWWFALYSLAATPALLGQSADQTTTAWAADTAKTLALATPQLITVPGIYYASIMVKATTVPSLMCTVLGRVSAAGAVVTGQKVLSQTSGAALTATAPATIATPTTVVNIPYVVAQ